MKTVQLAIIGGGPAGLAAAAAAYDAGLRDILILERSGELGGILNQCIHAGFGLHTFHQELTGPEYAQRYIDAVQERGLPAWTDCMVLDVSPEKVLTVTGRSVGLQQIKAQAVVLAMGCRERPRGALNIAGTRPAGIWSAGTAQRMVNMEGYLPGRQVVILGSGDIGLIMARRMTLEGAEVKAVAEVMPYSGGLKRNIVQCLDDFDIPLYLSTTVVEIHGQEHLTGVTLAQVDDRRLPVAGTERYIPCDTLLLSVGLLPENELTRQAGAALDAVTGGPAVDETLATSLPGVFACGNVLHVHDLVDFVTAESQRAGAAAADVCSITYPRMWFYTRTGREYSDVADMARAAYFARRDDGVEVFRGMVYQQGLDWEDLSQAILALAQERGKKCSWHIACSNRGPYSYYSVRWTQW